MKTIMYKHLTNQQGVTAVMVGIMLVMLLGFAALAIDWGHIYVVRNELQNAADAGALAGTRFLYINDGTEVNEAANQIAYDAAVANKSEKVAAEAQWSGGNEGDVQRGHWRFSDSTFTPNDSLEPVELWNVSDEELDANPDFINAVRVRTRRQNTPVDSFFARIFGHNSFTLSTEAVAYIGFAGTLEPLAVDQPIAICKESLIDAEGNYTCGVGRMINSGATTGHNTGGWTNFSQPCTTASTPTVRPLVCGSGNPETISLGQGMGATGGEQQATFNALYDCWKNSGLDTDNDGWPNKPWPMKLPVIECPDNNTSNCPKVVGTVVLNVIWITQTDKTQYKDVPRKMGDWACAAGATGPQCWESFTDNFALKDVLNNSDAIYEDKTIYFQPDCTPHIPAGRTGGENFGVRAKIPVLVK